jgi:hypothetical protein
VSILVVCTDRGTHPVRTLGYLLEEVGERERTIVFVPWAPKSELRRRDRDEQRGTLRPPPCPTCRRNVPMNQQTAMRRYDEVVAANMTSLDISHRVA